MADAMAEHFGVSEEERRQRSGNGTRILDNRIHWALGRWLGDSKLVNRVSEGLYEITSRGREVLAHPPTRIDHAYLLQFPEYAAKYGKGQSQSERIDWELSSPEVKTEQEQEVLPSTEGSRSYGVDNIIAEGCFFPREKIRGFLDLLRRKKNLVLQGPPGTGKTWLAKRLGYALLGAKERDRVLSVQFQPSLSYEDFVRGWRFSGGQFALIDGVFLDAAERARESSEPFVLVIEEINRGNPAQILGDLLTLIEADKRDASEAIRLSYVRDKEEPFYVPPNPYIIGTMNVADRSLALVDFALRRRFAFVDLEPQLGPEWAKWCRGAGAPAALVAEVQQRLDELNNNIACDKSLGRQFCIGHSFVTPAPSEPARDWHAWFKSVAESEIAPLLREYWYDNAPIADKEINKLLAGL